MTATLLDGTALAMRMRAALRPRIDALVARDSAPGLAVVLVGSDPASEIYVRNKQRACAAAGVRSTLHRLASDATETALLRTIDDLNADARTHGILVQMPLPRHIDPTRVIEAIAATKDVDGFHTLSAGALLNGRIETSSAVGFKPCTPFGVMRLLDSAGVSLAGARAVVIGRSNTVGKPMALMLLGRDATVTICHSATRDLADLTRDADVLISAVGRPLTVTADMVRPGAAVVDVGINRDADGKLVGDVDFAAVSRVAGYLSPVPGGVGPMTIAMLLENTVLAAERATTSPSGTEP